MHAHRLRAISPKALLIAAIAATVCLIAVLALAQSSDAKGNSKRGSKAVGTITSPTPPDPSDGPNCATDACKALVNGDATMSWNTAHVEFGGSLTGKATEVYTAATFTDKHTELWGTGSFEGTYKGRSGTATYTFSGIGTTAIKGPITFVAGTGGLRNLRGTVIWKPTGATTYSYNGRLHFAH